MPAIDKYKLHKKGHYLLFLASTKSWHRRRLVQTDVCDIYNLLLWLSSPALFCLRSRLLSLILSLPLALPLFVCLLMSLAVLHLCMFAWMLFLCTMKHNVYILSMHSCHKEQWCWVLPVGHDFDGPLSLNTTGNTNFIAYTTVEGSCSC